MSGSRFAVFLAVVLAIWALEHLYVGWRLLSLPLFSEGAARRVLQLVLVLGFLAYPVGRVLFQLGARGLGRGLEYAGAVWMGTLFLVLAALVAVEVVSLAGLLWRDHLAVLRGTAAAFAFAFAMVAWWGGMRPPRVVEHEVELPGLTAAADGFRMVQLSDVHLGTLIGGGRLQRLVDRTAELAPDAVAITGDLVDGDAGVVEELLPQLATLRAPAGVFAVLGNHEYYAGRARSRRLLANAGYTVLDNAAVEAAPRLWIAGVPDARGAAQTGRPEADLEAALAAIPEGDAVVLLQHSPEAEDAAAAAGVGLMLNGHTHGGQIWPFSLLVRTAYRHVAGRFQIGPMTQIVSRGAGFWGPPMRLGAPAEIIVVTLRAPTAAAAQR